MIYPYCFNVIYVSLIILVAIIVYHFMINNFQGEDFLNHKLFSCSLFGENGVSWWPISHFLFYFLLAFLFPKCWLVILLIAIFFEVIEEVIGQGILFWTHQKHHIEIDKDKYQYHNMWICGTFTDILFDSLGIVVGIGLSKLFGNQCQHQRCYPCLTLNDD